MLMPGVICSSILDPPPPASPADCHVDFKGVNVWLLPAASVAALH